MRPFLSLPILCCPGLGNMEVQRLHPQEPWQGPSELGTTRSSWRLLGSQGHASIITPSSPLAPPRSTDGCFGITIHRSIPGQLLGLACSQQGLTLEERGVHVEA